MWFYETLLKIMVFGSTWKMYANHVMRTKIWNNWKGAQRRLQNSQY